MTELPRPLPSLELLRFVRDNHPTNEELMEYLGGESSWQARASYSALRKSGMVILQEGRWVLLPEHLSPDGKSFGCGNKVLWLDDGRIDHYMTSKI